MRKKRGKKVKDEELELLWGIFNKVINNSLTSLWVTVLREDVRLLERRIEKLEERLKELEEKVEVKGHGQA
jgi:predicted nuclease with TOPRIM domain